MRFSELPASGQSFLVTHLGYIPAADAEVGGMPGGTSFDIFVQTDDGIVTMTVHPEMSAQALTNAFLRKAGYDTDDGYLTTGTKPIGQRGTVADLGIHKESTLTFVSRLRGGGRTKKGKGEKKEEEEETPKNPYENLPNPAGEKLAAPELSDKARGAMHLISSAAASDAKARKGGEKRMSAVGDSGGSPITTGESKWKLTKEDAKALLKKNRKAITGERAEDVIEQMGYVGGIEVIRVPPIDDLKLIENAAERAFEPETKAEMLRQLKKQYDDDPDSKDKAKARPSDAELDKIVQQKFDELMKPKGGGDGKKKNFIKDRVNSAVRDKEWLLRQMDSPDVKPDALIKEIDTKLKDNPALLANADTRKLPTLAKGSGYTQNCVADVISMDTGFQKYLMDTIISRADLRPSGTHGNMEKKLPTKCDPYSQRPDQDLYVEYGVGGGGGLRLVQNLETGDLYLSAHYSHFYLIEETDRETDVVGPPHAADDALRQQRLVMLEKHAIEVARVFGERHRTIEVAITGAERTKYVSFCKTAGQALANAHTKIADLAKVDTEKGQFALTKFRQQTLDRFLTTVQPIVGSQIHLLKAEEDAETKKFLGFVDKFMSHYKDVIGEQEEMLSEAKDALSDRKGTNGVPEENRSEYYQLLVASQDSEQVAKFLQAIYEESGTSATQKEYAKALAGTPKKAVKPVKDDEEPKESEVAAAAGSDDATDAPPTKPAPPEKLTGEWWDAPRDGNCLFHCLEKAGYGSASKLRERLAAAFRGGDFLPMIEDDREKIAAAIEKDGNYTGEAAFMADYISALLGIGITVVEETSGNIRSLGTGNDVTLARAKNHFFLLI